MTTTTPETTTAPETSWSFDIPLCNAASVRAKVAKLQRRAVKLGVAQPTISEGEPFDFKHRDENGKHVTRRYVPFTVSQEAPVKFNGWTFVATIDHGTDDAGKALNVLRAVPSWPGNLPKSYRTDGPTCDHCRTIRLRNETFVVHHEDGELRRVGRNCCADYLGGQEAKDILRNASWLRQLRVAFEDGLTYGAGSGVELISSLHTLIYAAVAIRTKGWTSKGAAYRNPSLTPTTEHVWPWLTHLFCARRLGKGEEAPPVPTAQDTKEGTEALEWARAIDPETDSDYLHNLRVILSRGSITGKELGLAVSAVSGYIRERDRAIALAIRNARPSEWLAEVGQRFGGKGKTGIASPEGNVIRRHSFEGQFGTTTILVVQTAKGDEIITFSSGYIHEDVQVGTHVAVTGTVKRHTTDSKTGRKQTSINRASFKLVEASTVIVETPAVIEEAPEEAPEVIEAPEVTEVPERTQDAPESKSALVIVLTAKTLDAKPYTQTFDSAGAAVEAGVFLRANGFINWRTIRYTLNGDKTNTPALRKLARS
jgi:hypothetical protein